MLANTINSVFVAQHRIDFRKGFQGLLSQAYEMELDPYKGDCVVFVHKHFRQLKIICGDAYGAWMLIRRFEGGTLQQKFPFLTEPSFVEITTSELALLLDGVEFEVKSKPKKRS